MGFSLEFIRSSSKQHSSSKTAKECSELRHTKRSVKEADKLKSKSGVGAQCSDLKQKTVLDAGGRIQDTETVRRRATERDELVKHMSNLPGYLQHANRVENIEEKAFNVGVLDWSRLKQWKQKHIPVLASNFISLNSIGSSSRTPIKPSTSVGSKEKLNDEKSLSSSGIKPSYRESRSAKIPFHDVKRFQSSRTVIKSIGDEKIMTPRVFESSVKTHSDISIGKEKMNDYSKRTSRVKNFASNTRLHGISSDPNVNSNDRVDGDKQNMEGLQERNHKKKERNPKYRSDDMRLPSIKSKGKEVSSSCKNVSSSSSETSKKVNRLQESDFDIGRKHFHSKSGNTVLLCPQEISETSSSEYFQLSESRLSSDENFSKSTKSSLSYVSLPREVYSEDGCSKISLSRALRSAVEISSPLETMQRSISTDHGIDRSSITSETPSSIMNKMSSLQSVDACFEKDILDAKLRDQGAISNLKEPPDQETAELEVQKDMNSSHNRRFSFSLSRIGRSFSLKEGPTLPQYSSTCGSAKSGPVTPQSSVRWDNPSKGKANSHNRNRSSPMQRFLNPKLKLKASDKNHSAQSGQTLEGSVNSSFRTVGVNESHLSEKSKGSAVQGLLQLTIKNGVPLFKFVLNNEKNIFAATRNSLTSLDKGDLGCCFTFYLVNEIKKKSSGWISHGNKEKNCGYAYNIIAQMKSSKITESADQHPNKKLMVKEYVLAGVEIGHTGQGPSKFIKSAEVAAVVITTSCENINKGLHDDSYMLKKGCSKCLAVESCLCNTGENDVSDCTTVILPGGIHGSPNKGNPSPLIYRWKSGGSCDCGGWDIGCRLFVLSNPKQNSSIPRSYQPYNDRFQLFVQGEAGQDKPLFTLLSLKDGFYSVEFDSTISHLQAFFISVAVINCRKLPGVLEIDDMHEEILKEPSSRNNNELQRKAPLKYAPMPPLSPVDRV